MALRKVTDEKFLDRADREMHEELKDLKLALIEKLKVHADVVR